MRTHRPYRPPWSAVGLPAGLLIGLLAGLAPPARAAEAHPREVPPPAAMAAEVAVAGPTSTAVRIDILGVGQTVPRTFSGHTVANTPGFS